MHRRRHGGAPYCMAPAWCQVQGPQVSFECIIHSHRFRLGRTTLHMHNKGKIRRGVPKVRGTFSHVALTKFTPVQCQIWYDIWSGSFLRGRMLPLLFTGALRQRARPFCIPRKKGCQLAKTTSSSSPEHQVTIRQHTLSLFDIHVELPSPLPSRPSVCPYSSLTQPIPSLPTGLFPSHHIHSHSFLPFPPLACRVL